MSADVAPTVMLIEDSIPGGKSSARRRSGVLNVWNEPSLNVIDQSNRFQEDLDPLQSSSDVVSDTFSRYGKKRQQMAFLAAVELLNGVNNDENHRKLSDPSIHQRASELKNTLLKKRCRSDTNGTVINLDGCTSFKESGDSLARFDSGIAVSTRPLELSSLEQTPLTLSDGESSPPPVITNTSYQTTNSKHSIIKRAGSLDDRIMRQLHTEDDTSSHHSAASCGSKTRRGPTKHLSQCSMGGSSTTFSSFYECTSNASIATDILSGLGFDDFDNPELIPDRFIPNEIDCAKPSLMKETAVLLSCTPNHCHPPPSVHPTPPSPMLITQPHQTMQSNDFELPLGATADNFLTSKYRSQSPPPSSPPSLIPDYIQPQRFIEHFAERKFSVYAINPSLETVPEETASDLSVSPCWLSPRVSLDHSYLDHSMPHLGTSLAVVANRKRSLPNREGYRLSVDSMLSEQDSTVYFSVTSYDDDIARELEDVVLPPLPLEDVTVPRRRRRGVHGAPPELLSWLQTNSIHEEVKSSNEEPWPFNEQLRLRRSLTEIEQRRSRTSSSETIDNRSLSPLPFHDPLAGIFPRRFSINGPLKAQMYSSESRRLSLPSNSSFRQYKPPVHHEEENEVDEENEYILPDRKSPDVRSPDVATLRANTKLPPGITRDQAREYKHDAVVLKSEVEEVKNKLQSSERVMKNMEEDYRKKYSDTQEWLRSELWMKEHRCKELEEIVESQRRDLIQFQQNNQIKIARAREEVREIKDKEVKEIHHKMQQREQENEEKVNRIEDECKQLRFKETQILKQISQHGLKNENEDLHREIIKLKEQLRKERETVSTVTKEKGIEIKQLRSKHQLEKEEALKCLKHQLTKVYDMEISSIKQQVLKAESSPAKAGKFGGQTPSKLELKKLRLQIEQQDLDLRKKEEEVKELHCQLKILHKEHLILERTLAKGNREIN